MLSVGKSAPFPSYMLGVLAVEDLDEPRHTVHLEVEEGNIALVIGPEMISEAGAAYPSRGVPAVGAMDIKPVTRLVSRTVVGTGISLARRDAAYLVQRDPGRLRDILKEPIWKRTSP